MSACDHKFVGSESCLKCGWVPNAAAIASRLQPMHVVPEPVTAPKPGDVVVERRHREAAMSAMGVEKPSSADYVTVFLDYGSDHQMSAPSDLCGSCNDTRANHEHHFESECQRFRERGDSGPCPWCERTDDHAHEFVDVLSAECDHELARLRAELASARAQVELTEAESLAGRRALAWLIECHETREMVARADGAFSAAVCHQQFAEWFRCGTPTRSIRGTGGTTFMAHVSDGLVMSEGDALNDQEALLDIEWAVRDALLALRAKEKADG